MADSGAPANTPSLAAKEAYRPHLIRFIRDTATVTTGSLTFMWLLISLANWFNWSLDSFKRLGIWGYSLLALVSVVAALVAAAARLFYFLRRDWIRIEVPQSTAGVDSGEKLSSELVAVVRRLHHDGEHAEVVRLGTVLSRPLWLSGRYKERIQLGTFFEDSAARLNRTGEQVLALIDDLGWTNIVVGNVESAIANIKRGIAIARKSGNFYLAAKGLRHLGTASLRYSRRTEAAESYFRQAEKAARQIHEPLRKGEMIAGLLYNRCEVALDKKDYSAAENLAHEALKMYVEMGDEDRIIKVQSLLAQAQMVVGDLASAKDGFRRALTDARRLTRRDEIGKSLLGLGELYLRENNRELARNTLEEAVEVFREIGSAKELGKTRYLLQVASGDDLYIPDQ